MSYVLGEYVQLQNEIDKQIALRNAYKRFSDGSVIHGTANRSIINIDVNPEYPLVSFISKISPSPDWFVGVHDYNLCNTTTGKWVELAARDLPPYDAGTDSGLHFESRNNQTIPQEKIYIRTNDKSFAKFSLRMADPNSPTNPTSTISSTSSAAKSKSAPSSVKHGTTSSVGTTYPTEGNGSSATSSVTQLSFIHIIFAVILKLLL